MDGRTSAHRYVIKVAGRIDLDWSNWFHGLAMVHDDSGNTVITGSLPDQAALHGLLTRVGTLGLRLLSVEEISGDA